MKKSELRAGSRVYFFLRTPSQIFKEEHRAKMHRWVWLVVLVCIFVGTQNCSRESADELFSKGEEATHQEATYPQAEASLKAFLEHYPDDPRADLALQALARVLSSQHKHDEAISRYEELVRRFPDSRYADQAQFMIGYTYDQNGRYSEARKAYQTVIDRFPNSDLVDDAEVSIANLGKPPEAWFPADSTGAEGN